MADEPNYPTVPASFLKPAYWVHCSPALLAKRGSICATGTRRACACDDGKVQGIHVGHDHLVPVGWDSVGETDGPAIDPSIPLDSYITHQFASAFGKTLPAGSEELRLDRRARLLATPLRQALTAFVAQVGRKPAVVTNGDIQVIIRKALRLIDENHVPVLVSELAPLGDTFLLIDPNATIKLASNAEPIIPARDVTPESEYARRYARSMPFITDPRKLPWRLDPS
jgi:hypothetical protein